VIYIRGFSGDLAYRLGNEFVKETYGDPKRLLHQAWKQRKYGSRLHLSNLSNIFRVPRVTSIYSNGFKMEYIEGKNILEIMENEPEKLEQIVDAILKLLNWEFSQSVKRPFRVKPFIKKLSPVCPKEFKAFLLQECKKLRFRLCDVGMTHGDLSCANMVFADEKIYLVDFLRVFYRTPYQDVAKLYQECDLHWAMLMSDYSKENKNIKNGYDYLTWRLNQWVESNKVIDGCFVKIFRLMCLCRLFPYIPEGRDDMYSLIYKRCVDVIEEW